MRAPGLIQRFEFNQVQGGDRLLGYEVKPHGYERPVRPAAGPARQLALRPGWSPKVPPAASSDESSYPFSEAATGTMLREGTCKVTRRKVQSIAPSASL